MWEKLKPFSMKENSRQCKSKKYMAKDIGFQSLMNKVEEAAVKAAFMTEQINQQIIDK